MPVNQDLLARSAQLGLAVGTEPVLPVALGAAGEAVDVDPCRDCR